MLCWGFAASFARSQQNLWRSKGDLTKTDAPVTIRAACGLGLHLINTLTVALIEFVVQVYEMSKSRTNGRVPRVQGIMAQLLILSQDCSVYNQGLKSSHFRSCNLSVFFLSNSENKYPNMLGLRHYGQNDNHDYFSRLFVTIIHLL